VKQLQTTGIILRRTDYGEADRIVTMLTPEYGKLSLMAKGVRRVKSKLAGGIELFSVSDISFIQGRSEVSTLVSTRLITHYGNIAKHIDRTMLGYDLIKKLHKATEDSPEPEYFELLHHALEALDDPAIDTDLIQIWFLAQLLVLAGHTPNLVSTTDGKRLQAGVVYEFSHDDMTFVPRSDGHFTTDHIKFLRLCFGSTTPPVLQKIQRADELAADCLPLLRLANQEYIRQ
jgi:DNA repair protein RecO (recombination protein O)